MPSWLEQSLFRKKIAGMRSEPRYDPLQGDNESSEKRVSGSSADVSLMSEQMLLRPASSRTISKRLAFSIIGLLSFIIIIMALLLARQATWKPKSPVPDFPRHARNFTRQLDWEFSAQSQQLWADLIPDSGLVLIENPSQYGLGPGLQTVAKDAQVYGVAVTHQFHCLQMIREAFYGLAARDKTYIDEIDLTANSDFSSASLSPKTDHIFHCFDYLRQTVLCNADTTVEGQSLVAPTHIDGYGPLHQCRNWDDVRSWMQSKLPPDPIFHKHPGV